MGILWSLLPVGAALVAGSLIGMLLKGRLSNLWQWRPAIWWVGLGGVALSVAAEVMPVTQFLPWLTAMVATAALGYFCLSNLRVGGMVVILAGLALNLLVSLPNGGIPTSRKALVGSRLVAEEDLGRTLLNGPRHVAVPGKELLGFLGETIVLPGPTIVTPGDLIMALGVLLVTSSVVRRRQLRAYPRRAEPGGLGGSDYRHALSTLKDGSPAVGGAASVGVGSSGTVTVLPAEPVAAEGSAVTILGPAPRSAEEPGSEASEPGESGVDGPGADGQSPSPTEQLPRVQVPATTANPADVVVSPASPTVHFEDAHDATSQIPAVNPNEPVPVSGAGPGRQIWQLGILARSGRRKPAAVYTGPKPADAPNPPTTLPMSGNGSSPPDHSEPPDTDITPIRDVAPTGEAAPTGRPDDTDDPITPPTPHP